MLLCPLVDKNGKIKTYKGFQLYEYVSENKHPCRVIKYKAYMPRKGIVTRPYRTLRQVKKEVDYILNNFIVCEPLKRALPRTKKKGGKKKCRRTCARMA